MNIIWNEEDYCFFIIPDGDKATHRQIKEYYETRYEVDKYGEKDKNN